MPFFAHLQCTPHSLALHYPSSFSIPPHPLTHGHDDNTDSSRRRSPVAFARCVSRRVAQQSSSKSTLFYTHKRVFGGARGAPSTPGTPKNRTAYCAPPPGSGMWGFGFRTRARQPREIEKSLQKVEGGSDAVDLPERRRSVGAICFPIPWFFLPRPFFCWERERGCGGRAGLGVDHWADSALQRRGMIRG